MFKETIFAIFCAVITVIKCQNTVDENLKLIIDNDAGDDDAVGIFLAILCEKYFDGPEVIGLTTVNGNTNEDNVSLNNQKILKIAQKQNIPIYRGSKTSILVTPYASGHRGDDGLGDNEEYTDNLVAPKKENAVWALIEHSKLHRGKLIVITLGPLTNIALAMKIDPNFLGRLHHIFIGAGHIYSEDYPSAETNARTDSEAYHIVVQNATPDKVTMLPYSQVQISLNSTTKRWRDENLGTIDTEIIKAMNIFERKKQTDDRWRPLDPANVAIALKPDLVDEFKFSKNDIILIGDKRGTMTNHIVEKLDANVRVAYGLKEVEFQQFLKDVFYTDYANQTVTETVTVTEAVRVTEAVTVTERIYNQQTINDNNDDNNNNYNDYEIEE